MKINIQAALENIANNIGEDNVNEIIEEYNTVFGKQVTSLTEDPAIFATLYMRLMGHMALVGITLDETADEGMQSIIDDASKEDEKDFIEACKFASEVIRQIGVESQVKETMDAILDAKEES